MHRRSTKNHLRNVLRTDEFCYGVGNASAFQAGWFADIKNISTAAAGIVTITPTGSTINGASTLVLWPGQGGRIVSDGANYQVDFAVGAPLTNSLGADVPPAPVESMDAARAR